MNNVLGLSKNKAIYFRSFNLCLILIIERYKMKVPNIILIIVLLLLENIFAQSPDYLWVKQAGGIGIDFGSGITVDNENNYIVVGQFSDTAIFGDTSITSAGMGDIFVAKYNMNGVLIWVKQAGGVGDDFAGNEVSVDNFDNIVITGSFESTAIFDSDTVTSLGSKDIFIAKYDAQGNLLWVISAGGASWDSGIGISNDNDDNCIVTGYYHGNVSFGDTTISGLGSGDIFLAKYDLQGNFVWVKQAGGAEDELGFNVKSDDNNNYTVVGSFYGEATFGDTTLVSRGSYDIFIAKYDLNGNLLWLNQAGGSSWEDAISVVIDNEGNNILTGWFSGVAIFGDSTLTSNESFQMFCAKYDVSGNFIWAKQTFNGSFSAAQGRDITTDVFGNIYITGYFGGSITFGDTTLTGSDTGTIFTAGYNKNGDFNWVKPAIGAAGWGLGVSIDKLGDCIVTGQFSGETFFGDTSLTSLGEVDIFITKILSSGVNSIENTTPYPLNVDLSQNYPNPFNPSTTIIYQIPSNGNVTLKIYDILGREVTTLIDEFKTVGRYEVNFNAATLASGVYFYRIVAEGDNGSSFNEVKSMVLTK